MKKVATTKNLTEKYLNLDEPKFNALLIVTGILLALVICVSIDGMITGFEKADLYQEFNKTINREKSKKYSINIIGGDKQKIPCELTPIEVSIDNYDSEIKPLDCKEVEISGKFSDVENAKLDSNGVSISSDKDGKFTSKISRKIPISDWAKSDFDTEKITSQKYFGEFVVKNTVLNNDRMADQSIEIDIFLTDKDKATLKELNSKYLQSEKLKDDKRKAEEAERARREAEEKQRAEIERRNEEYRQAAEARRRQQEAASKNATPQPRPQIQHQPTPRQQPQPRGPDGYCRDGTPAYGNPSARGRANSCWGHGGWNDNH
ncbi:MAG: hypothetical protein Q4A21_02770 [bacterium]|nr:hypothetical protein [bacterium]